MRCTNDCGKVIMKMSKYYGLLFHSILLRRHTSSNKHVSICALANDKKKIKIEKKKNGLKAKT